MPRKVDSVQRGLVTLLQAHGATFQSMTTIGKGAPDGIVGYRGITDPVEFKDPKRVNAKTPTAVAQAEWRRKWRGSTCWILTDWQSCERMLESMQRRALALDGRVTYTVTRDVG